MGRKGKQTKKEAQAEAARLRAEVARLRAISANATTALAKEQPGSTESTVRSERPEPQAGRTKRAFAVRTFVTSFSKGLFTLISLIAFLIGVYSIRPVPTVASPIQADKDDPMFFDFVLTDQGQTDMKNVVVDGWPVRIVYGNGDTLGADPSAKLMPTYANKTLEAGKSLTARYAPLFKLIVLGKFDRAVVVGREQQCIVHSHRPDGSHETVAVSCPVQVIAKVDPYDPSISMADMHISVKYQWKWLPLVPFRDDFRFIMSRNGVDAPYRWEPVSMNDPEIPRGNGSFLLCLDCPGDLGGETLHFRTPAKLPQ